ncbi:hypothetical protein V6N13_009800 [Hibiscus sabdariffa]
MPVPTSPSTDCRIWKFERYGVFTVSSGYKFLIRSSLEQHEVLDQHNVNRKKSFYGYLWSLKVPPKVKITFWRFVNNFIHTLANLNRRRLNVEETCVLCGRDAETIEHLNWFSWLSHLFTILSKDMCALLVTAVWALWYCRNNKVHENWIKRESFSGAIVRDPYDLRGNPSQELLFVILMVVYWQPALIITRLFWIKRWQKRDLENKLSI